MRIAFNDFDIRKVIEDEAEASVQYGESISSILKVRVANIIAAISIHDLISGNLTKVFVDNFQGYSMDLADGLKLVFKCNHTRPPVNADGEINWDMVDYIKFMKISKL